MGVGVKFCCTTREFWEFCIFFWLKCMDYIAASSCISRGSINTFIVICSWDKCFSKKVLIDLLYIAVLLMALQQERENPQLKLRTSCKRRVLYQLSYPAAYWTSFWGKNCWGFFFEKIGKFWENTLTNSFFF